MSNITGLGIQRKYPYEIKKRGVIDLPRLLSTPSFYTHDIGRSEQVSSVRGKRRSLAHLVYSGSISCIRYEIQKKIAGHRPSPVMHRSIYVARGSNLLNFILTSTITGRTTRRYCTDGWILTSQDNIGPMEHCILRSRRWYIRQKCLAEVLRRGLWNGELVLIEYFFVRC